MADLIQIRRDVAVSWSMVNPKLAIGEVGIITDVEPKQCKIGDGVTYWNDLPVQSWAGSGSLTDLSASIATVSSNLTTVSSSLDTRVNTNSSSLGTVSSSLGEVSSSLNSLSSSYGTASGSFDTRIILTSSSLGEVSSSFNSFSSSYDVVSGSFNDRITSTSSSLETVSSSLGTVSSSLGTVSSSLNSISQSISGTIASISSSVSGSIAAVNEDMKENYALQNGSYEEMSVGLAQDLDGNIGRVASPWKPIIRTTAGDFNIHSDEPAYLISVVGATDNNGYGLRISGVRFNGFNALIPTQVLSGYTLSGETLVASGTNKIAYFRCVQGIWGDYGILDENNGYMFTDNSNNKVTPITVKTTTEVPVAGATLTNVPTTSSNGYTFYLPQNSGDYLCVEFASSVDLSNICAHLAWDNEDDDKFESRSAATIDLSSAMSAGSFTTYGLLDAGAGSKHVTDGLVCLDNRTQVRWTKRLLRVSPASLTWSVVGTETSESITTTTFQATLSTAAASDPAIKTNYSSINGNLYWDNADLKYTSTVISGTAALAAELGTSFMVYEVATPTSGTVSINTSAICHDMGTEEILGTDLVNDLGTITTSYVGTIRDYIRNLPTQLSNTDEVIAKALTEQQAEINRIKDTLSYLSAYLFTEQMDGKKIFLEGSGSPDWVPDMPYQIYRDRGLTTASLWISVGNTNASQWRPLTN